MRRPKNLTLLLIVANVIAFAYEVARVGPDLLVGGGSLQGLIDAGEFVNTYQANCKWFDIGNPADYARAQALITSSDDTQL